MTSNSITAVIPNPEKSGYMDIYVDGNLFITVTEEVVVEGDLAVGELMDADRIKRTEFTVAYVKAKHKALEYLSYSDMSAIMLLRKLTQFGFSEHVAESVCDMLEIDGYINDEKYAKKLARHLAEDKLYGPIRIRNEMHERGIDSEYIEMALESLEVDYEQSVIAIVDGKFHFDLSDRKEIGRVASTLIRYGYDYEMIGFAIGYLGGYDG